MLERLYSVRDEVGQSLVVVVLAMGLIVGLAAFGIDVSQWEVSHHKAQVTADASALAAANCLAAGKCTQITAGGDAEQAGDAIAADNGVPQSGVSLSFSGSTVTATVTTSVSSAFAGFFGFSTRHISASATASYASGVVAQSSVYAADCTNPTNPPGGSCTVNCSSPGVTISSNGHTTISGAIETNGYVNISIGGGATLGPVQSGPGVGTTCGKNVTSVKGSASIANGPANATGYTAFPTTYGAVWTNSTTNECTPSSTYTASGYSGGNITVSGGTSKVPSTITFPSNNTSVGSAASPVVMCASTSITIQGNKTTLTDVTLVAPSIVINGNTFSITADPNALADGGGSPPVALYQTGSSTLDFGTNNVNITGAVYAPLAGISVQGNNGGSALLEGNTVLIDGNNGGDGPQTTLTGFAGSDQLIQ